jgi:hypothetical protein
MKRSTLVAVGLTALAAFAPFLVACGAEDSDAMTAQYPSPPLGTSNPLEQSVAATGAPGESPTPIAIVPTQQPPAPPPASTPVGQPYQEAVPGETSEEEYNAEHAQDVAVGADPDQYADADPSAISDFRATLDPYGSWVDDPNYGTVWTPSQSVVGDNFSPYVTAGQWTYDDYDNWVWVSDYDWGWAPFHYGRWAYLGNRWGWIPGRQYAGAWVTWRQGYGPYAGYLGWAPIPPRWGWRNGGAFGLGFATQAPFVFCGVHDVFGGNVGGRIVAGGQVGAIGAHSVATGGSNGVPTSVGRVAANPSVGSGRVPAHPGVGGPSPVSVGIPPTEVAHTPRNNRGLMHAEQFARPSSAQALGAHAAFASESRRYVAERGLVGYGRNEAIASAPQYRGIAPGPHYFPSHTISGGYGGYGGAHYAPSYGGSRYGGSHYASPAYGGGGMGHYGVYPGFTGSGGYGAYRGGVVRGGGEKGSSSTSTSSDDAPGPVIHHEGGGGFRGGGGYRGGGGGGHGGGGGRR